eukprot:4240693-Pleurochrysis_carterae.AAC.2
MSFWWGAKTFPQLAFVQGGAGGIWAERCTRRGAADGVDSRMHRSEKRTSRSALLGARRQSMHRPVPWSPSSPSSSRQTEPRLPAKMDFLNHWKAPR